MDRKLTRLGMANDGAGHRLYPRLLGAAWDGLDPAVQRVHADDRLTQAEVVFQVSRAPGRLLGLVLDAARVPGASGAARVRLAVVCHGPAEHWCRSFEGRPLETVQTEGSGGLLVERVGALELRFRLAVQQGDLLFRQQSLTVRLGPLWVRLPQWLAIQVAARESAAGQPDQTKVEVRVMTPGGGLLFSYRGSVRWTVPGDAR